MIDTLKENLDNLIEPEIINKLNKKKFSFNSSQAIECR